MGRGDNRDGGEKRRSSEAGQGRVHRIDPSEFVDLEPQDFQAVLDEVEQLADAPATAEPARQSKPKVRERTPAAKASSQPKKKAQKRPQIRGQRADDPGFKVKQLERRLDQAETANKDFEKKLNQVTQAEQTWKDKLGQLTAETARFRKRMEDQADLARLEGREEVFKTLLPIMDNLERGLHSASTDTRDFDRLFEGLELVIRQLVAQLQPLGLVAFDSLGQAFDPARHEAFRKASTGTVEPGCVVEEVRRGYFFNDRLLRPALVVVEDG